MALHARNASSPNRSKGEFMVPLYRPSARMVKEVEMIVDQLRGELRTRGISVRHVNPNRSSSDFDKLIITPAVSNGQIDTQLERDVRRMIDDIKRHVAQQCRPGVKMLRRG